MTSLIRRYRGLEDRDEYDTETSRAAKAVEIGSSCIHPWCSDASFHLLLSFCSCISPWPSALKIQRWRPNEMSTTEIKLYFPSKIKLYCPRKFHLNLLSFLLLRLIIVINIYSPRPMASDPFMIRRRLHDSTNILKWNEMKIPGLMRKLMMQSYHMF